MHKSIEGVLRFFAYRHLPPGVAEFSQQFHDLAHTIAKEAPDSPEMTIALRLLLQAKDAAVRAYVFDRKRV